MSDSQGAPDLSQYMPQPEGQQENTQEQGEASLSGDFLSKIPEADRAVVGRYVKDWDSGVTKRFQEIHDQYKPYKDLGSVEQIQQAMEVYDLLDNSPEVIYEALQQHFGAQQNGQNQQIPVTQPQQPPSNPQLQQTLDPFLTPLQSKLDEQQKMLENMAQVILAGNQREQEAAEDRALDQYLADLEQQYGKFDQRAVLMGLYEGKDGPTAIKEWKDSLTQWAPQPQQNIPPPLMGGSVPSNQVDVGQMSDKDVKQLTANVFAALQNQQ